MSIGVKTRFEVFKRDRFTCAYCGNHPPDVLLEVDHVIARAAGGTDEMENLVTACWDCNRGKSDRLLDEGSRPTVSKKTVAALEERLEQAKAYVYLLSELSRVTDSFIDQVTAYWATAFDASAEETATGTTWKLRYGTWPKASTVRVFLRDLSLEEIFYAIDAAASRVGDARGNAAYFYKVCWRLYYDKKRAGAPPPDSAELETLRTENMRLLDELAEERELIADLRISIRRLREEAGRE